MIIPPTTTKQKIEKDKIAIADDGIPSAVYLFEVRHFNYKIDNITQKNDINKCLFSLDIYKIYDIKINTIEFV